ncbi:protein NONRESPONDING TO OXYLIPINS 2, mitochondrial isoform X1 [Ziziphus jujuba]|uniref:Protein NONRESPONDING TO OXYLIPINS 2, mitochondrial isoform X1 n=1 Tax=Ziziphus jujuba TaxID=326968 RepID=A0ABM3HZW3_ZIZJJ|nr:protein NONRESPONDING TO OXYLIPINS 2, mitochondrial isoform X1 [Ziziphus jujuba]
MAFFCRSALMAGTRSIAARSRTVTPKSIPSPFSSSTTRAIPRASRIVTVLGSVESLMPLHSAIASARLKSSIAMDSTCWSCLSQGLGLDTS